MKSASTSVECALSMKYPLGPDDISTGSDGNILYGEWKKNIEEHTFLARGRGNHYGPKQLKVVWPLLKNMGSMEEYSIITIARNPLDILVSYFWYSHAFDTLYGYWDKTVPRVGDNNEVIREKFQEWSRKDYRCPVFKEHISNAPLETPHETLSRINEPQLSVADIIIKYSNLQEDCKNKLGIHFPLPKFKTTERSVKLSPEYYFENDTELKNLVISAMPITIKMLEKDTPEQNFG